MTVISNGGQFYVGVVEDRNDPLGAGRVRVRVAGLHYHDKEVLPTKMLPWAMVMQPAAGGTGASAVGPAEGTTCIVVFEDYPENQYPIVIGTLVGIPQGEPVHVDKFESTPIWKDEITPQGRPMPTSNAEVNGNQTGPIEAPAGGASGAARSQPPATTPTPPAIGSGTTAGVAPTVANPALQAIGAGIPSNAITPGLPSIAGTAGSAITGGLNALNTATGGAAGGLLGTIGGLLNSFGQVTSGLTSNPIAFLSDQGSRPTTAAGVVTSITQPGAQALGAVGGILGSINQVGATMNIARNQFESLGRQYGNLDSAVRQFTMIASQSGPLGNALSAVMNGNASLKSIAQSYGIGVSGIQSTISSIKSATSISGVLQNSEMLMGQIGGLITGTSSIADTVIGELSQASVTGTIGAVTQTAQNIAQQVTGELTGTLSAALNSVQSVAGGLGLGNVTGAAQGALASVNGLLKGGGITSPDAAAAAMKQVFSQPEAVAAVLNNEYSTGPIVSANVGNIAVTQEKPMGECTAADFKGVEEGTTPPVLGSFGGPNFGGASPVLEKPKDSLPSDKVDTKAGSQNALNVTPPKGYDSPAVRSNIRILLDACMKHGLSTKEQQAALLGIVGGECGWVPQSENCQYSSPDRLCQIFQSTFKGKPDLAQKYANWKKGGKGTEKEFFNFVYDPSNNGRQLGNTRPGDGGKYYGRGFIQLTGRGNYEKYERLTGHKIVDNPDLANDPKVAADLAVFYLMDRVKGVAPTAHPGYFYAAKKSVGNNSADIAARKLGFYEHFYGTMSPESFGASDKQAGNSTIPGSYEGAAGGTAQAEGKTDSGGFKDPNGKYPLNRHRYEPQTSRLARGVVKDSIVLLKESKRERGVPIAMDGGTWDQPGIPFGAKYPYNHVRETESGHVQEFDDTPGYERIHTYHRSGTFEEIDATGTLVRKIVGDGYYILERNGFITVAGDCNLTVSGNVNIFCRSDANIEVAGSAEMKVGGNMDLGVARDMRVSVDGNFSLWANGSVNLQAKKNVHILGVENTYVSATQDLHLRSDNNTFIESKAKAHVKTAAELFLNSTGATHIKADGNVEVDGANINLNSGTASPAEPSIKALINGMVPPPPGSPIYPRIEKVATPQMHGEEQYMFESSGTSGGQQSQASQKYNEHIRQNEGKSSTYEAEKASPSGGGGSVTEPANKQQILACNDFHGNYKLSKNFTLGMLFDGGYNGKHKLVAQCGLTPQQIVANLASVCENILEKYLEVLPGGIAGYGKQWVITSGYRMGNGNSDHGRGRACDISLLGAGGTDRKVRHHELVQKLDKLVSYDQLILEYRGPATSWIHTGFRQGTFGEGSSNRKMGFTMVDDKTYNRSAFVLVT